MSSDTSPVSQVPIGAAPPSSGSPAAGNGPASGRGELDLLGFALFLFQNLRFILGCGLVALLIMTVFMLLAKPRYAATAVMIVPQTNVTAASLQAQLSLSTMDLLGGGNELYADILKSRTVADRLIANHGLLAAYKTDKLESAEDALGGRTTVETAREGVIRVTVQDTDRQRAADLANDYLRQLDLLNTSLVLSTASQQRAFFEREMVKEKDALADAEVALKQLQESDGKSGLPPEAEATAALTALETTRAQLRANQVRLAALLTAETDANPEVVRLRSQIADQEGQLVGLERGQASSVNGTPTNQVPARTLEFTRRLRDVKFHETLFGLLEKEFETAKQQEAKSPSIVQVLDQAVPPKRKAWPPRLLYCLVAAVGGVCLGALFVSLRSFFWKFMQAPENRSQIQELKSFRS